MLNFSKKSSETVRKSSRDAKKSTEDFGKSNEVCQDGRLEKSAKEVTKSDTSSNWFNLVDFSSSLFSKERETAVKTDVKEKVEVRFFTNIQLYIPSSKAIRGMCVSVCVFV